jgi:MarR family transcriptional regulator, organic hydroperoxide resistance regulator
MSGDPEPREEIMRLLMDLFARTLDHQGTYLETLGLTYSQAKLLWRLEIGDTLPLKELARRCGVDPSNLAGVVDQLTERKLVLSRPATHDKRVRVIRLTANGVRLRRRLVANMSQNPVILALPAKRQDQLLEILREVS